MTYELLKKLHYTDDHEHGLLYSRRFNSPTTKHFDFSIREYNRRNEYPAFFCYTEKFMLLVEEIYRKHEQLLKIIKIVPALMLDQFILLSVVDEVRATSDIEGVHSTRREIMEVIDGTSSSDRFSSIVGKYKALIEFTHMNFKTCADIRRFYDEFTHSEISAENPRHKLDGELFRKDSVEITSGSKIIHQGVYPEIKIVESLNVALKILNNEDIPFFVRVSVFHYLFEYIHPFYDGNGRIGRFIASYFLAERFHPLVAMRLSVVIKRRKKQYYDMFRDTDSEWNCGDLTPFVLGFTEIISATFDDLIPPLDSKYKQLSRYKEFLSSFVKGDDLTRKIYEILLESSVFFGGGVSMDDLIRLTEKSRNTVKPRLNSIPENHIVKSVGKKIFYKLNAAIFKN